MEKWTCVGGSLPPVRQARCGLHFVRLGGMGRMRCVAWSLTSVRIQLVFFLLCFNVQFVQTSTHSLFGEVWCWATGQKTSSGPVPLKRTNGSRNGYSLWFSSLITCFACGNHCHGGIQAKVAMAVLLPCGSLVWQAL